MPKYISVKCHLGRDYVVEYHDEEQIEEIEEECDACFDSDTVIGIFDTEKEAKEALEEIVVKR